MSTKKNKQDQTPIAGIPEDLAASAVQTAAKPQTQENGEPAAVCAQEPQTQAAATKKPEGQSKPKLSNSALSAKLRYLAINFRALRDRSVMRQELKDLLDRC